MKTLEEAKALVGKTFGTGHNAKTVTRVVELNMPLWGPAIGVFWLRPGESEQCRATWLPSFLKMIEENSRRPVEVIEDVENELSTIPEGTKVQGFFQKIGNKVTVEFEIQ